MERKQKAVGIEQVSMGQSEEHAVESGAYHYLRSIIR